MIAGKLISDSIPSVSRSDSASQVLTVMEVFRVSHLPVVEGDEYIGVVADKDIFDGNNFDASLECIPEQQLLKFHVHPNQHIFEVAALAMNLQVTVVPV
ncbi:MAG: CBS domain-containing protein [Marinilabiliales bacterium]|nr:CBS domain-containing protein [Marinilabiliales bacterium]